VRFRTLTEKTHVSVLEQESKPRTRPGGFEGGNRLKWLKAKRRDRLVDGTEANAAHVKLALEYDIDVWVEPEQR
jgi:hypothetical protein